MLHGCSLVLSGVVPTGVPVHSSRIFRLATSLGAKVSESVVTRTTCATEGDVYAPQERTTHVLATKFGTAKVRKAQRDERIRVVNPLWLYSCAESWERVPEQPFLLRENQDFQSHPVVVAERRHQPRDPASTPSSSSSSTAAAPVAAAASSSGHPSFRESGVASQGASEEGDAAAAAADEQLLADGLMDHPLNQLSMFSSR